MPKWLSWQSVLVSLFSDFFLEAVSGFESGYIVSRNNECGVLADVTGCLLGTDLYDERAETTEIHVFAVCGTVLHYGHELFDYGYNRSLVDAGCLCDLR